MRIMHIFGGCAFQHNMIPTASLSQNCVGVIKDKHRAIIPLLKKHSSRFGVIEKIS